MPQPFRAFATVSGLLLNWQPSRELVDLVLLTGYLLQVACFFGLSWKNNSLRYNPVAKIRTQLREAAIH
jgi:hypothetical protein